MCNKDVVMSATMDSHLSKAKDKAVVTSTTMDSKLLKARRKTLNGDKFCHNSFVFWKAVPRKRAATKF